MPRGSFEIALSPQIQELASSLVVEHGSLSLKDTDNIAAELEGFNQLCVTTDVTEDELEAAFRALPGFFDGLVGIGLPARFPQALTSVGFEGSTYIDGDGQQQKLTRWHVGGTDQATDASVRYEYCDRYEDTTVDNGQVDRFGSMRSGLERRDTKRLGPGLISHNVGDVRYSLDSSTVGNGPRGGRFERARAPDTAYLVAGTILYLVQRSLTTPTR